MSTRSRERLHAVAHRVRDAHLLLMAGIGLFGTAGFRGSGFALLSSCSVDRLNVPQDLPTAADDSGTYSGHGRCTRRFWPPAAGPDISNVQSVAGRMSVDWHGVVNGRRGRIRRSWMSSGGGLEADQRLCIGDDKKAKCCAFLSMKLWDGRPAIVQR